MKSLIYWVNNRSKRARVSIFHSITVIGAASTILSILGISLGDLENLSIWMRLSIVIGALLLLALLFYWFVGRIYRESVGLVIRKTPISISCGDIFNASGLRVIGCDTHFDTRVDDIVISKTSLHGQLFLEHGEIGKIEELVMLEAKRLGLSKNKDGQYDFPLGTIIPYDSQIDNHTYLMLAMTELNSQYESHTNMAKFEHMLMKMWKEIDRVYARHDIAFPILGDGISRFDDGPEDSRGLIRCMLCTLNSSAVTLKSNISILIYGDVTDIPLYEYKDILRTI